MVTAVIGVLAGLLLPVLAQAKTSARNARCLANLRQLGLATLLYVDDWDGAFPHDRGPRFSPSVIADRLAREFPEDRSNRFDGSPVAEAIRSYVREEGVLFSPHVPERAIPENGPATGYQVNAYLFVNTIPEADRPHGGLVSLNSVVNPSRTTMWQTFFNQGRGSVRGGQNRVAVDGHARWQPSRRTGNFLQLRWWVE